MSVTGSEISQDSEDHEAIKIYGTSSLWFQVKKVRRWDIFFLLVNIVIGSQFRISFAENIWETFFDFFFTGIGYVCLAASLAEMISALPFSGGIYGIVRAFTHPFLGFYVACFELLISFLYLTQWMYEMSHTPIYVGLVKNDDILYLLLPSYVIVLVLCILGGKIFWSVNGLLAVATLSLVFIYIFGSIPNMNFDKYGQQDSSIDFYSAFHSMPSVSLAFIGIQLAPLSIQFSKEPKKDIPVIMTYTMMFLVVVALLLVVFISYQYPGAAAVGDFPVSWGFSKMFNIPLEQTAWLTLPGLFATNFGFMYCFGRQATCMAGSGLLPSILKKHVPIVHTPWLALVGCGLICYLFSVFVSFNEDKSLVYIDLTTALASYVVYIFFFVAYLQFKISHCSLERGFTSPFGKAGGFVGIVVFVAGLVGGLGFQHDDYIPVVLIVAFSLFVFLIFWFFLRGTHEFSEEEKGELSKAYLINANKASKNRLRKGKFVSPIASNLARSRDSRLANNSKNSASSVHSKSNIMTEVDEKHTEIENILTCDKLNLPAEGTKSVFLDTSLLGVALSSRDPKSNKLSSADEPSSPHQPPPDLETIGATTTTTTSTTTATSTVASVVPSSLDSLRSLVKSNKVIPMNEIRICEVV